MSNVTRILSNIEAGDQKACEDLLPLVYDELRRLAAARMVGERPDHTLSATALVHEAYIRLIDVDHVQHWDSRWHFFSAAAEAMRRILIESARQKKSQKAGGGMQRVQLAAAEAIVNHPADDLLILDDALTELLADDAAAGQIAKLRLYAGMSVDEAAKVLGVSRRSGFRHWSYARAFLQLRVRSKDEQSAQ